MAPLVSVVTLNYNGGDDTLACLDALKSLQAPGGEIEVIVVDNDSSDGSADRIASAHPEVTLIRNKKNLGFAGGCNSGAARAKGEFIAFINNDARPDPRWLVEAVSELRARSDVACVASKVLSWDGTHVDYDGACGVTFYGFGYRERFGEPVVQDQPEEVAEVLFGTGSGLIVRREAFEKVHGFDDRFFLFFEDVDFGWRLWLAGYRVLYVPTSVVFHRHHGTMKKEAAWREDFLLERNALFTLIKNLDDEHLDRALPAALMLAMRRGFLHESEPSSALDLERGRDDNDPSISVGKRAAASAFAVDQVARRLPELLEARSEIQANRVRADHEIFRLVRHPMLPSMPGREFGILLDSLDRLLGIREIFSPRRRIAIVTGDPLGRRLSGPGIRALELAKVLARSHDVRLASTSAASLAVPGIGVEAVTPRSLHGLIAWSEIVVFQGFLLYDHPWVADSDKTIVADLYDPFHLEQLEQSRQEDLHNRTRMTETTIGVLNQQVRRGDFFMCASGKQRDFWLGQLAAMGRINPATYDADETLGDLLAVVPFGISETPPRHERKAMRGVVPGIGPDDKIVLWGGGLYPWFDPLVLVQAIDLVRATVPDVRLVFMGAQHPNANVPASETAERVRALAADLGLLGEHVFLLDHWVEYDDRQNYLLEADIGVSTHLDHIETAFSFRTRILDYIWAGLPIVTTGGDAMAELVAQNGLGEVVDPGDVKGIAHALESLLLDPEQRKACSARVQTTATEFTWSKVAQPLVQFCGAPSRAADVRTGVMPVVGNMPLRRRRTVRHLVGITLRSLKEAGVRTTGSRIVASLRGG